MSQNYVAAYQGLKIFRDAMLAFVRQQPESGEGIDANMVDLQIRESLQQRGLDAEAEGSPGGMASMHVRILNRVLAVGLAGLCLASALSAPPTLSVTNAAPAQPTAEVPADWQRVDTGAFSLSLPPGWRYNELRGIDSFVGEFVGDDVRLEFDFGLYSSSLADPGTPGHDVTFETIGGKEAKLVLVREPPGGITGVYFPEARIIGWCDRPWVDKLNVYGHDLTSEQQATALVIFRSIRFPGSGTWEVVEGLDVPMLSDVHMLSEDNGWAVGAEGTILHYTGGAWTTVESPTEAGLMAIDMVSPDEGWAVGDGVILRYADGAWSLHQQLAESATLTDIDMVSPDDGWAVGIGQLMRYRDGGWQTVDDEYDGFAIDMASADDGWTVFGDQLHHYVAGSWERVAWPADREERGLAIDMVTDDYGWMVGVNEQQQTGVILQYCDGQWAKVEAGVPDGLWGIDMDYGEGWAVGGWFDRPALLIQYRDDDWTAVDSPTAGLVRSVDMLPPEGTWAPIVREGWAVGGRSAAGGVQGIVLHYTVTVSAAAPTATPTAVLTRTPTPTATPTPTPTATATATPPLGSTVYLPAAYRGDQARQWRPSHSNTGCGESWMRGA